MIALSNLEFPRCLKTIVLIPPGYILIDELTHAHSTCRLRASPSKQSTVSAHHVFRPLNESSRGDLSRVILKFSGANTSILEQYHGFQIDELLVDLM